MFTADARPSFWSFVQVNTITYPGANVLVTAHQYHIRVELGKTMWRSKLWLTPPYIFTGVQPNDLTCVQASS